MNSVDIDRRQSIKDTMYFKEVYGKRNPEITGGLIEKLGAGFAEHTQAVRQHGITRIPRLFGPEELAQMRVDLDRWESTKPWDRDNHMGFDGNSGERYLPTSESISRALTNPAIYTLASSVMGEHPRFSFHKTVFTDSVDPYERRAYQWHHDGYSEIGVKTMVLLTDVPEDGQAMLYVPGSSTMEWDTSSSRETRFDPDYVEQFEAYPCAGKAGDVFLFSNHAIHRGQRNLGPRRDILLSNWQPGLGRNYPLPGLHPDVIEGLTPYERFVFGIDGVGESGALTDFQAENEAWRATMGDLYKDHVVSEAALKSVFAPGTVDRKVIILGEANKRVTPQGEPFADAQQVARIDEFKEATQANLLELDDRLELAEGMADAFALHNIDFPDAVHQDLIADLDLEIRMYHHDADQKRDNAITRTRDGRSEQVIQQVVDTVSALDYHAFLETDVADYETLPDRLLRHKGEISILNKTDEEHLETDSVLSFTKELSIMIKRAYNEGLTRRTMLYTYLMGSALIEQYGEDPRLPERVRDEMRATTDESLIAYTKLLMVDKTPHELYSIPEEYLIADFRPNEN